MAATTTELRTEETLPVYSRVGWGGIVAGAIVAAALYVLLGSLGLAIGLTVQDGPAVGAGTAIYTILITCVAIFFGSWVATQCSIGENRAEAVVYGIIVWGFFFGIMLWLLSAGVQMGFDAMMAARMGPEGGAAVAQEQPPQRGVAFAQEEPERALPPGAQPRPEEREMPRAEPAEPLERLPGVLEQRGAAGAWWMFAGIVLTLVVSILGAIAGSGPKVLGHRRTVGTTGGTRYPPPRQQP
jgi:hypothetical protein